MPYLLITGYTGDENEFYTRYQYAIVVVFIAGPMLYLLITGYTGDENEFYTRYQYAIVLAIIMIVPHCSCMSLGTL